MFPRLCLGQLVDIGVRKFHQRSLHATARIANQRNPLPNPQCEAGNSGHADVRGSRKKVTETYLLVLRSFRRWCTRALISFWVSEKVLLFTRFSPTARYTRCLVDCWMKSKTMVPARKRMCS